MLNASSGQNISAAHNKTFFQFNLQLTSFVQNIQSTFAKISYKS